MSSQVLSPNMVYNTTSSTSSLPFRNPLQQRKDIDRRVLHLNNRACVLVLSNGEYSEAIKLFDTALMIHKEQTEEGSAMEEEHQPPTLTAPQHEQHQQVQQQSPSCPHRSERCDVVESNNMNNHHGIDCSCHSSASHIIYDDDDDDEDYDNTCHDFSEEDISETEFDEDFGDMDWDDKLVVEDSSNNADASNSSSSSLEGDDPAVATAMHQYQEQQKGQTEPQQQQPALPATFLARSKIPRMTTASRLRTLNYCGQQEYHAEHGLESQHHYHHQVYSLPIVMEESEWDTAPIQDKTFVLIFNTALCNHLWGMQLMQRYISATTTTTTTGNAGGEAVAALAEHCRETLTIAKLLYKLALENSVSFANGVDKMCYVALYNNLSHVLKTLEGYDSAEAQWCDDMLLKAIFWWRDSTNHHNSGGNSSGGHSGAHPSGSSGRSGSSNSYYGRQHTSSTTGSHTHTHTHTHTHSHSHHSNSLSDMYLDDDAEIIDAFLENVYYRVGVPENIVPAAAA